MIHRLFLPLILLTLVVSALAGQSASRCYPALSLATSSVPGATAGVSYSTVLAATGGQPPYTWSLAQSSLPQGFSVSSSGDLSGTPSTAGTYAFNVIVSDALKNNVTGTLALTVASTASTQPAPTPTPTPTPGGPATGTALNACGDITKSGAYYLSQDVSSAGTCFWIDADNVTLNLNGHTITYATGSNAKPAPAIVLADPWYLNLAKSGTTQAHGNAEIYGGNIVEGAGAGTHNDVIWDGQSMDSAQAKIHDLTATIQGNSAAFFYVDNGAVANISGWQVYNNTVHDNVTTIVSRYAFDGMAIFINGQQNLKTTYIDNIHNNTIIGSPQGGIFDNDQGAVISGNDISQNASYTNDFCIDVEADGQTISGNHCHPTEGRGIDVDASHVTIIGNTITTTELPNNAEYNGCEIGGAYGIRVEAMQIGAGIARIGDVIENNNITANAGACNALGMDLIYLAPTDSVTITGNTITTTNAGKAGVVDGVFNLDDLDGTGVTIAGNTLTGSAAYISGGWDGYHNVTIGHNTWGGSPKYTMWAGDGGCDPSQKAMDGALPVSCPVSVTVTDPLPNTVYCGPYSEATVTINSQVTQCKGQ